jgi:hypothetical protein
LAFNENPTLLLFSGLDRSPIDFKRVVNLAVPDTDRTYTKSSGSCCDVANHDHHILDISRSKPACGSEFRYPSPAAPIRRPKSHIRSPTKHQSLRSGTFRIIDTTVLLTSKPLGSHRSECNQGPIIALCRNVTAKQ